MGETTPYISSPISCTWRKDQTRDGGWREVKGWPKSIIKENRWWQVSSRFCILCSTKWSWSLPHAIQLSWWSWTSWVVSSLCLFLWTLVWTMWRELCEKWMLFVYPSMPWWYANGSLATFRTQWLCLFGSCSWAWWWIIKRNWDWKVGALVRLSDHWR